MRETSDAQRAPGCLLIGASALTSVDATFEQCFGQQPAVVVADENTFIDTICRSWPSREEVELTVRWGHDIPELAENAVEESLAKYIDAGQLRQWLTLLQERWPTIRERVQAQLMTAEKAHALLQAAGCPTHPDEIGVSMEALKESYTLARTIRSRYMVLDLANESGVLAECVHELFAPGGFWFRSTVSERPIVHRQALP